jgi:hypothetical protein
MSVADDKDRAFIAKFAFVLFIAGMLLPFAMAAGLLASAGWPISPDIENTVVSLAFGFGFIAEILALTFGIVGRKVVWGRIGIVGAAIAIALGVTLTAARPFLFSELARRGPGLPPRPRAIPSVPVPPKPQLPSPLAPKNSGDAQRPPVPE